MKKTIKTDNKAILALATKTALLFTIGSTPLYAVASPSISGGVWYNYAYVKDSERDEETMGTIGDEALILYFDDKKEGTPWSFSGEVRYGPGAYTRPATNSTGDNFGLHKAWVGYQFKGGNHLKLGKSQVPFGWKNVTFWPGDLLMGGYGDQMDVGAKLSGASSNVTYNLAYYHADDWGQTSTDTMDDNGHWGTSTTYRKIQTVVLDGSIALSEGQRLGASFQSGKLQDLTGTDATNPANGDHSALAVYYKGKYGAMGVNAQYTTTSRNLPDDYAAAVSQEDEIKNNRMALELTWSVGDVFLYADATWAKSETDGNDVGTVHAYGPGMSYNYGPGWAYVEYLSQSGYISSNGMVGKGDYDALYVTLDYYF